MATEVKQKKRRRRDPLGTHYRDEVLDKYQITSSCYLDGSLAMTTPSQARKEAQSFTLDEMRRKNRPVPPIPESEIELVAEQKNLKDVPNIYLARQHAIFYLFKLFGSPERDTWRESRIVPLIMEKLSIPRHSYRSVIAVLNSIDNQESEEDFISFAPSYNKKGVCGVQAIIKDNDETANVIYRAVSNSMSDTMITFLVNVHRRN